MEVQDAVTRGGVLVWGRCGHTLVHEQLQWQVAAGVDLGLEVGRISQVEGGGQLLSGPVLWRTQPGARDRPELPSRLP